MSEKLFQTPESVEAIQKGVIDFLDRYNEVVRAITLINPELSSESEGEVNGVIGFEYIVPEGYILELYKKDGENWGATQMYDDGFENSGNETIYFNSADPLLVRRIACQIRVTKTYMHSNLTFSTDKKAGWYKRTGLFSDDNSGIDNFALQIKEPNNSAI